MGPRVRESVISLRDAIIIYSSSHTKRFTSCVLERVRFAHWNRLGVGIALKQFHRVSARSLQEAVQRVLADSGMQQRARELAERLQQEDGATSAARTILSLNEWQTLKLSALKKRQAP